MGDVVGGGCGVVGGGCGVVGGGCGVVGGGCVVSGGVGGVRCLTGICPHSTNSRSIGSNTFVFVSITNDRMTCSDQLPILIAIH